MCHFIVYLFIIYHVSIMHLLSIDHLLSSTYLKFIYLILSSIYGVPWWLSGKVLPAMREMWVLSLGWEDPLEEEMATHSSVLAWRIPEQRSLVDYSLRTRKEADMT